MEHKKQRIPLHFLVIPVEEEWCYDSKLTFPLIWYLDIGDGASTFYHEFCLPMLWMEYPQIALPYSLGNRKETVRGWEEMPPPLLQIMPNLDFQYRIQYRIYL